MDDCSVNSFNYWVNTRYDSFYLELLASTPVVKQSGDFTDRMSRQVK